ncbi:MAG: c-type cytochrome [Acidobacteriota bacterium]
MKKALSLLFAGTFLAAFGVITSSAVNASDPSSGAAAVTFSKDVAPIFFKHCADCHRPNELAPMSLLTFKDSRPWARSIKEKVVNREMPPWHADAHYGQFTNDRKLTQQEIDTIVAWVDQGAREGNRKDLPAPPAAPRSADGWKIGKPDVVLSMQEEYTLDASGADEYINFTMPTTFKEDVWIQAAEIHPGNRKVVHHVIAFIQTPQFQAQWKSTQGKPSKQSIFYQDGTLIRTKSDAPAYDDGCSAPNGGFARGSGQEGLGFPLCFYTPGKDMDVFPPGTAKSIPAGSNIVIQIHYSKTTGKVEKDRSSVGLFFAKAPPERVLTSFGVINHYFKIPPGADNHEVKACYTFSRDVELLTFLPHMHVRGKDMKYEAIYPDGRRETVLFVPNYNFNWQTLYKLDKPLALPKGTKLLVTAHYDNSERNKSNPDPAKTVRFGDPTYDEMMVGYFDYVSAARVRKVAKIDLKTYDAYSGDYAIGPQLFTITREGDKLMFSVPGQGKVEAFPESETKFFFTVIDAQVTFMKNERGDVIELLFEVNGMKLRAKKVNKVASDFRAGARG